MCLPYHPIRGLRQRCYDRRVRWVIALLLWVEGCGGPSPIPPRVAQALEGQPHGCAFVCSVGSYCDPATGSCIRAGSEPTSSSAAGQSAHEPEEPLQPGLVFACVTASGLEDEVVASDLEAATHACTALDGERCSCHPANGETTD